MMTLQLGCRLSVLLLSMLLMCKHRFCDTLWLTIFCALALYYFICDMETSLRVVRLIMELVGNHRYTLTTANGKRCTTPQEWYPSGIRPGTPFLQHLLYTSDLPTTVSRKYAYTNDLVIMHVDGD